MTEKASTLILGIGNTLLGDEGIGVHIIEHLQHSFIPEDVEVVDGGTAGADLLEILCNRDRVIIIDAINGDYPPGTVVQMTADMIAPPPSSDLSLHELDLPQTLTMAKLLRCAPKEVLILGIQPEKLECSMELSPRLKKLVPDIANQVLSLLN